MKNTLKLSIFSIALLITVSPFFAKAANFSGPSDSTTAPPATAALVGKIVNYGQTISISGPEDANNTDFAVYHWYKLDASGNKQLLTTTTKTLTEGPTGAGYYNYELVTENANGCTSVISDEFQVFVLPRLTASVTATSNAICTGTGSSLLTANIKITKGYTFNYQWSRNGTAIAGATASTYNVTGEAIAGVVAFELNVAYSLSSSSTVSTNTSITVTQMASKPLITAN